MMHLQVVFLASILLELLHPIGREEGQTKGLHTRLVQAHRNQRKQGQWVIFPINVLYNYIKIAKIGLKGN